MEVVEKSGKSEQLSWFSTFKSYRKEFLAIWLLFVGAGLGARFYVIAHGGSFWFDEAITYTLAKMPFLESWRYLQYENSPPLHFFMVRIWGLMFGFEEFALRLQSVFFGILTFGGVIVLASKLFNRQTGLWAGLICATSSYAIFFDTEVRMYNLLAFLLVVANYYFIKIFFEDHTQKDVFAYVVFSTLSLYAHVSAIWLPLTHFISIVLIRPQQISRFRAMVLTAIPGLLYVPWILSVVMDKIILAKSLPVSSWWYFTQGIPIFPILYEPIYFFNLYSGVVGQFGVPLSFFAGNAILLIFMARFLKKGEVDPRLKLVAICFVTPLLIMSIKFFVISQKYFYHSIIFFWIVLAYELQDRAVKSQKVAFTMLILLVGFYSLPNLWGIYQNVPQSNWNEAAQWIDEQKTDFVLAMPELWAAKAYEPTTPFVFLLPPVGSLISDYRFDSLQAVLRYNYSWAFPTYSLSSQQRVILGEQIKTITSSSTRLVFGHMKGDVQKTEIQFLYDLGFRCQTDFRIRGRGGLSIGVFERVNNLEKHSDAGCHNLYEEKTLPL